MLREVGSEEQTAVQKGPQSDPVSQSSQHGLVSESHPQYLASVSSSVDDS